MDAITPIVAATSVSPLSKTVPISESTNNFGQFLSDALNKVNDLQKASEQAGIDLAAGKNVDISDVMIAAEKANLAVGLTVQVRNKVIEAYQEIMRMQL